MSLPSVALALALAASAAPAPGPWMKLDDAQRAAAFASYAKEPLAQRLLAASGRFMGTPYVFNPLGEGQGPDPDPLIRYDEVDCVTFVETAMALALAKRVEDVEPVLTRIRYRENPVYEERNHLMEADWIPNNLKKGFIEDVTRAYGGADTTRTGKTFTEESWTSKAAQGLHLPKDHQAKGTFTLPMIPLEKLVAKAKGIPSGTILIVIRKDQPDEITRISHLGFVVQEDGKPFVRHAALTPKKVVDEPLEDFVARHAAFKKWPVEGFALYGVREPSPN